MQYGLYLHNFSERLAVAFEQTELCSTCQYACQTRCCPLTGYEIQRLRGMMEERLLHLHTVVLQSKNQALCICVCCSCITVTVVQILPAGCGSVCCCQKPDLQHHKRRFRIGVAAGSNLANVLLQVRALQLQACRGHRST